ncbi:sulfurtransferase TusA family protein [Nocardiopsis sp. N85]|uniref:Sulfurtransferase TusA family protein n=1 Tax=Nocardiopsis lambiniae TaxID=3075539 RepID=A0ABU2M8B6_9ACTN|nr:MULTISPECIES: sulfurtransferase TusA family protein [unclassified Nocardiopsis]MDE3724021.1 sulfurtransferase TusA family protein [Nocardiopsis sp. N85]MDT0328782.1 sulfurtransferase TusA family protein [Nocardiopsis sp. DSM 44743]
MIVEAVGRKCPIPIIWVARRLHEVPIGGVIAVTADDPAAKADIPAWCRMKMHEFVAEVPLARGSAFHIRRMY